MTRALNLRHRRSFKFELRLPAFLEGQNYSVVPALSQHVVIEWDR
jgi:hypothetical protein